MVRLFAKRALVVGIICFMIALGGFYLIFSWESWRSSQIPVYYDGPNLNRDPFAGGDIFLAVTLAIIIELILLPILAGSLLALALPSREATKKDVSRYAGFAGAIPLALISFIFWAMFIAGLINNMIRSGRGLWVPDQAVFYLFGMFVNVMIVLAGAFVSSVSGQFVWTIYRNITRCR
jgi:hypothetical protein